MDSPLDYHTFVSLHKLTAYAVNLLLKVFFLKQLLVICGKVPNAFMCSLGHFNTKRFFIFFLSEPIHIIPSVLELFISNPLKFLNTSSSSNNVFAEFSSDKIAVVSSAYCNSLAS